MNLKRKHIITNDFVQKFLINTRLRLQTHRRIWKRSNKQEEKDTVWQKK